MSTAGTIYTVMLTSNSYLEGMYLNPNDFLSKLKFNSDFTIIKWIQNDTTYIRSIIVNLNAYESKEIRDEKLKKLIANA